MALKEKDAPHVVGVAVAGPKEFLWASRPPREEEAKFLKTEAIWECVGEFNPEQVDGGLLASGEAFIARTKEEVRAFLEEKFASPNINLTRVVYHVRKENQKYNPKTGNYDYDVKRQFHITQHHRVTKQAKEILGRVTIETDIYGTKRRRTDTPVQMVEFEQMVRGLCQDAGIVSMREVGLPYQIPCVRRNNGRHEYAVGDIYMVDIGYNTLEAMIDPKRAAATLREAERRAIQTRRRDGSYRGPWKVKPHVFAAESVRHFRHLCQYLNMYRNQKQFGERFDFDLPHHYYEALRDVAIRSAIVEKVIAFQRSMLLGHFGMSFAQDHKHYAIPENSYYGMAETFLAKIRKSRKERQRAIPCDVALARFWMWARKRVEILKKIKERQDKREHNRNQATENVAKKKARNAGHELREMISALKPPEKKEEKPCPTNS